MKEHVEYEINHFIDFKGDKHYFVIAAVSQNLPTKGEEIFNEPGNLTHEIGVFLENFGTVDYIGTVCKVLKLGIAFCHPKDKFDPEVGKKIALERAKNNEPCLYGHHFGDINKSIALATLESKADHIIKYPERYITGYKEAELKYSTEQQMSNIMNSLSTQESEILSALITDSTYLDTVLACHKWLQERMLQ